jgi:hypothetical protein
MQPVSMTTINWLTLFTEMITFYSHNHTKYTDTLYGQTAELLIVKGSGTYGYHWVLKI